jgi:hypothetical protein
MLCAPKLEQVVANLAKYRPAELSRLLWGFAAAHHDDGALVKAVSKALTDKAAELAPKEAVQVLAQLGEDLDETTNRSFSQL